MASILPALLTTVTRAERESRRRARAGVRIAECLAEIARAADLPVEAVRDPSGARKADRSRARLARHVLVLWLRREFQLSARHIALELELTPAAIYQLLRIAERSVGAMLWAVDFCARMKPDEAA